MPQTLTKLISDTASTMIKNTTTAIINDALHMNAALAPIVADNPEDAELVSGALAALQTGGTVGMGIGIIITGAAFTVAGRVIQVETLTTHLRDESSPLAPSHDKVTYVSHSIEQRQSRSPLTYTSAGETRASEDNELVESFEGDKKQPRPRLPGIDNNFPVLPTTDLKPVQYTKTTTAVTGVGIMSTGVSTALTGLYDGVAGLAKTGYLGGQRIYHLFKKPTPASSNPANPDVDGPNRPGNR